MARYSLSEAEEKIITSMEVTGTNALVKIYDRLTNSFEFEFNKGSGKKKIKKLYKNKEKLLSLVRSPRPEDRESAYRALWRPYEKNRGVLGDIYQNIAIQWYDENVILRGFKSAISVRNVSNNLDDSTVDILLSVCKNNSKIFQDYFTEKAKIMGMRKLRRYDLYAPLSHKSQRQFKYENAIAIILKTFDDFHPTFRRYLKRLVIENHIDSEIRIGKVSGAFCYSVSPKRTPYVLLNFDGKTRDVSTMAHEFGHAIHSMAASDKSILVSHAPLPLAETASVFAEMLLNDKLTEELNKQERKILLAEQIDDFYATTIRQAYFTLFEIEAHHLFAEKNSNVDEVCDVYLQNLREQFGDALSISEKFKYEWLYIPHFYHTPFYCYAYSFGNLLVLSLYQQYKKEGRSFIPKYIRILSSGGSEKPEKLLNAEGIDISKESFWQQGFNLIREKIQVLKDDHKSNS
jgi:oligoendopeptidase F